MLSMSCLQSHQAVHIAFSSKWSLKMSVVEKRQLEHVYCDTGARHPYHPHPAGPRSAVQQAQYLCVSV